MTRTRWLFEAYQLRLSDESRFKEISLIAEEGRKGLQEMLASLLGVNMEPIVEPDPSDPRKTITRWPKPGEFTPLIMAIARPDYLAQAFEKIEELKVRGTAGAPHPHDEYTETDLQFFDELEFDEKSAFWNDPTTQSELASQVLIVPEGKESSIPRGQQPPPAPKKAHPTEKHPSAKDIKVSFDDMVEDDGSSFGFRKR